MSNRSFHFRLQAEYEQPDNQVARLTVQRYDGQEWDAFKLDNQTPGFEIFAYALFTCQHTYFRLNCAEQGAALRGAQGELELGVDEEWNLSRCHVTFRGDPLNAIPDRRQIDYIIERMGLCPVSKNLRSFADQRIDVSFAD